MDPAACFIAVDESDVRPDGIEERREFTHIVLSIAIGVEDELFGGRREPGAKGSAIPAIFRMRDDAQARTMRPAQGFQHRARIIDTAVVDDDNFKVPRVLIENGESFFDQIGEGRGIIICRKKDTQAVRKQMVGDTGGRSQRRGGFEHESNFSRARRALSIL